MFSISRVGTVIYEAYTSWIYWQRFATTGTQSFVFFEEKKIVWNSIVSSKKSTLQQLFLHQVTLSWFYDMSCNNLLEEYHKIYERKCTVVGVCGSQSVDGRV